MSRDIGVTLESMQRWKLCAYVSEAPTSNYIFEPSSFTTLLFLSSYLPSCEGGDHECPSSERLSCIAQRGDGCSRASFGGLGGNIFDGTHSKESYTFHCFSGPWTGSEEEIVYCLKLGE